MAYSASAEVTIASVLRSSGLDSFGDAFENYGLEHVSDLDEFKDEELKKEFSMNAAQLKKLRLAAQEGALGVPLESPQQAEDPNLVDRMKQRNSLTNDNIRLSWGVEVASPRDGGATHQEEFSASAAPATTGDADGDMATRMFLADLRLESFFGAFLDFGVGKLADLMDDELLGDEELKSDIGLNAAQIASFRQAVHSHASMLSPTSLSSAPPSSRPAPPPPPPAGGESYGQYSYGEDDDGSQQLSRKGKPGRRFSAPTAGMFGGGNKPKAPEWLDDSALSSGGGGGGGGAVFALDSFAATSLDALVPPNSINPPKSALPTQAPPAAAAAAAAAAVAAAVAPMQTLKAPHPYAPPPSSQPPTPAPVSATLPHPPSSSSSNSTSMELSFSAESQARLSALPASERSKVDSLVAAALAGLETPASPHKLVAKPSAPPSERSRRRQWGSEVGALLPLATAPQLAEGGAAAGGGSIGAAAGGLALSRAVGVVSEELAACDQARQQQLPFDDADLLQHEGAVIELLRSFLAGALRSCSATPYLQARSTLVNARIESKGARSGLEALQATIARQREAGDLDAALMNQATLVGRFTSSIATCREGYSAGTALRKGMFELSKNLAGLGANPQNLQLVEDFLGAQADNDDDGGDDSTEEDDAAAAAAAAKAAGGGMAGVAAQAAAMKSRAKAKAAKQAVRAAAAEAKKVGLAGALRQLDLFQRKAAAAHRDLEQQLQQEAQCCDRDLAEVAVRAADLQSKVARIEAGEVGVDDDEDGQGGGGGGGDASAWLQAQFESEKERVAALVEAERAKSAEVVALLEGQLVNLSAGPVAQGDKLAYLELSASQLRAHLAHLDQASVKLSEQRRALASAAEAAEVKRRRLVQERETKKVANGLSLEALEQRRLSLEATRKVYGLALDLTDAMGRRTAWVGECVGQRLRHVDQAVTTVMDQCLGEHLFLASAFVEYASVLLQRKERDLEHLAARLFQHAQERRDAIERDNADDMRRADRDKEETLASQKQARRTVNGVAEQKARAVDDLLQCLVHASNRPLGPKLLLAAQRAVGLVQECGFPDRVATLETSVHLEAGGVDDATDDSDTAGGATGAEQKQQQQAQAAAALEQLFRVDPSVVEGEVGQVLGGGGAGVFAEVKKALAEAAAAERAQQQAAAEAKAKADAAAAKQRVADAAVHQAEVEASIKAAAEAKAVADAKAAADQMQRQQQQQQEAAQATNTAAANAAAMATTAATAAAAAEQAQEEGTVHVQMKVPLDAVVGSYLQASVKRNGQEYHFSVCVPVGATPGETMLTVPVPIPKGNVAGGGGVPGAEPAAQPARPPAPPPLPPPSSGFPLGLGPPQGVTSTARGMDVVAGYLMDCGVDFEEAFGSAQKLVDQSLDSVELLKACNAAFLKQASGLSQEGTLKVLHHRNPDEVLAELGGGCGGSSGGASGGGGSHSQHTGRGKSYSIDALDEA